MILSSRNLVIEQIDRFAEDRASDESPCPRKTEFFVTHPRTCRPGRSFRKRKALVDLPMTFSALLRPHKPVKAIPLNQA